jgi:GT2 family glycosyltransferase
VEGRQFPFEDPKEYDGATGETHWCSARCLLIPRFVFEITGGFDEALPTHAATIDFCWRAWQSGCRCLMTPSALIHCPAADPSKGTPEEKLLLETGRVLAQKWQCPKFRVQCERALAERGYFRSIAELPSLPVTNPQTPHRRVDFEHELAFAPTRW